MFITKMSLPRRRFLQGVGTAFALPFLDAMVPAATALANTAATARRFGAVFVPMGAVMDKWTPHATGAGFEFTPILKPLEPFRDHLVVVSGTNEPSEGTHSRSVSAFLSGSAPKRTEAEDVRVGTTIDQMIAGKIGADTQFSSLGLAIEDVTGYIGACDTGYSCAYQNTMSWKTPTMPLPMETNPRVVFERLFGRPGTPAQRLARRRLDASILDSVRDDAAELNRGLGPRDKVRLTEYLENVRDIEKRIQRAEQDSENGLTLPATPVGIPDLYADHAGLMFDLIALAYEADLTRVATFMMAREASQRIYPEINFMEPHHHVSHHRGEEVNLSRLVTLQNYHLQQFAKFVKKLASTPDGDGSLLDHTMLLYGSGMSNSDIHSPIGLPLVVLGGQAVGVKGNRHLQAPTGTPHANLLVDIVNKFGLDTNAHGVSNGRFEI
ncbi:MAG: DUF1552 domain-containing protein [Acidobacteriota bacterium]